MEMGVEAMYEYWFAAVKGISGKRKAELRRSYPLAEALYNIEEIEVKKGIISSKEYEILQNARDPERLKSEYDRMCQKNIHFCTVMDGDYPDRLKEIYSPPYALYYVGKLPTDSDFCISVVGARQCTYYGKSIAQEIGKMCAANHISVVSGMARGIDGISQSCAVDAGGKSFAVLGCGVDICYPPENRELFENIKTEGGVISEYSPGTAPLAKHFPARNRIISGLSDALVVVEAKEKSGSLITADFALDQGKTVYAVPGPVTSALSRGCNRLIKQGAEVFLSVGEMMDELKLNRNFEILTEEKSKIKLETRENMVYSCLDLMPQTVDDIRKKTPMDVSEISAILMSLEMKDCVEVLSRNYYVKKEQYGVYCS